MTLRASPSGNHESWKMRPWEPGTYGMVVLLLLIAGWSLLAPSVWSRSDTARSSR
jgi:hypothetical protein